MKIKMSKTKWFLCILTAVIVASCGTMAWLDRLPKDEELIRTFQAHRDAFETIVAMVHEDPEIEVITRNGFIGGDSKQMPKERVDKYLALASEIGLEDWIAVWRENQVMFYFYRHGYAVKGICFWPKEIRDAKGDCIVAGLDNWGKLPRAYGPNSEYFYPRPIDDRWSLFLWLQD